VESILEGLVAKLNDLRNKYFEKFFNAAIKGGNIPFSAFMFKFFMKLY